MEMNMWKLVTCTDGYAQIGADRKVNLEGLVLS